MASAIVSAEKSAAGALALTLDLVDDSRYGRGGVFAETPKPEQTRCMATKQGRVIRGNLASSGQKSQTAKHHATSHAARR